MNSINDDDIDALLRRSFDGPAADDGFCDRVMQQLPPRRRHRTWPRVAGVMSGAVLGALSLYASPLWHSAWREWLVGQWSGSSLATLAMMTVMSLLALAWSLAETEDR